MTEVYIAGRKRSEDDSVCLSLTSSAIVFVIKYCRSVPVKLIFVHKGSDYDRCVAVQSLDSLGDVKHEFASEASLPAVITNCSLPVAYDSQEAIVRSGLCCTVRHIIKLAHAAIPEDSYQDLLVSFKKTQIHPPQKKKKNNNKKTQQKKQNKQQQNEKTNKKQRRKEGNFLFNNALNTFYLRLYGIRYMVKDYSAREVTCCRHIGYSLRLTARVLLYAPSHRQDNIPQPLLHKLWSIG